MLPKIELNNALICFQKTIRKAKGFTVNKIVKKLKIAKAVIEKHPDSHKHKVRIRKLDDQLDYIKRSNTLEVAILALTSTTKPHQILTNSSSKPEDVVLAYIQLCKGVKEAIAAIKTKLNLDSVISWEEIVKQFGRNQLKKKSKLKIDKTKKKSKKIRKENKKQNEWIVENIDTEVDSSIVLKSTDKRKLEKLVKKPKNVLKNEPYTIETEICAKVDKSIDSFFITNNGENYMATAVPERQNQQNQMNSSGAERGQDRKSRRAQKFGRQIMPKISQRENKLKNLNAMESNTKNVSNADVNVHPSWIAKKKLNSIAQFEGKKTKFNDNEENGTKNTDNLHPSWLAKQKLKPVISEFKGTKITFNDDD